MSATESISRFDISQRYAAKHPLPFLIELDPGEHLTIAQVRAEGRNEAGQHAVVWRIERDAVANGRRQCNEVALDWHLGYGGGLHLGFLRLSRDIAHAKLIDGGSDHIAAVSSDGGVGKRRNFSANDNAKGGHESGSSSDLSGNRIRRGYGHAPTAAHASITWRFASSGSGTGTGFGAKWLDSGSTSQMGCVQLFTRVQGKATATPAEARTFPVWTGVHVCRTDLKTTPTNSAQRTP